MYFCLQIEARKKACKRTMHIIWKEQELKEGFCMNMEGEKGEVIMGTIRWKKNEKKEMVSNVNMNNQ